MNIDMNTAVEGLAGAVTAIGGIYTAGKHFITRAKKKKERYRQEILDQASSELARVEAALSEKIKLLEIQLAVQKDNVSRDLGHLKEVYNAEIKVLADKIDDLRKDLSDQHQSMVALLTKLVDNR